MSAVSLWEKPLETGKDAKNSRPSQANLELVVAALGLTMARFYGPLPKIKSAA